MPRRVPILERAAAVLAAMGIAAHILVGVFDERRLVLHPVGHLTIILLWIWVITAAVGVVALVKARGRGPFALGALLVAGIGTLLLFTV